MNSFRFLVWGLFFSALQMCLYFSAISFPIFSWWALSMQTNFTSWLCDSSSFVLVQVMKNFFSDYLWKPIIPFWRFSFNVHNSFWCSIPSTTEFVFSEIKFKPNKAFAPYLSRWCREGVSDLRRLWKFWTFWNAHKFWTWWSIVDQIWMNESGYTSLFHCVGEKIAWYIKMSVSHLWIRS